MQAGWILFCLAFSIAFVNRPTVIAIAAIVIRVGVPSPASPILNGVWAGAYSFHPAGWLIVTGLGTLVFYRTSFVSRFFYRNLWTTFLLFSLATFAIALTVISRGFEPLLRAFNVVVVPLLLFVLIRIACESNARAVPMIARALITLAAMESVLGVIQSSTGKSVIFGHYNSAQYWWPKDGVIIRGLGTLDSPLDLAALLVGSAALLFAIRSVKLQFVLFCVFAAGILSTQSRLAIGLVAAIGVMLVYLSARDIFKTLAAIVVAMVIVYGFLASPLATGVIRRFTEDDGGSSATRSRASQYLLDNLHDYILTGGGSGYSFTLQGTVLRSSLENGYGIFVFDFGMAFVLVYLLLQIAIIFRIRGGNLAYTAFALSLMVMIFAYSSMATQSAVGCLAWAALALRQADVQWYLSSRAMQVGDKQAIEYKQAVV